MILAACTGRPGEASLQLAVVDSGEESGAPAVIGDVISVAAWSALDHACRRRRRS